MFNFWLKSSYYKNDYKEEKGFEVLLWNAARINGLDEAISENGNDSDVIVLIEYDKENRLNIETSYPNYYFYLSKEGIGVFSKTPIKIVKESTSNSNSTVLNFKTNEYNFYAVDVSANILNSRKEALLYVESKINVDKKTIVLGDFNTPTESVHFHFFKEKFKNAFSEKGNGFRETWFWNIPLLSLDHIWISKELNILNTMKICTWKSDHVLVKTIVRE
ncbi:endonuclease/exonuclease/phosphatase family protein [Seonamhaeicola marinus]|uniref:Endonuclease/exonuclease/phosphatase family protein n=1 Tax=Seonamhaeicola marinus TaxID=1912246 RepID=A0A5D0HXZ6_9FLAO|nr:endonuclease/exonuclease/phosphatase family protein [Seonamhaeicola marinus]TYA74322.1 endonuclease/exonuclease/phosphatase family protein [Seonamhaeicola marinus]